MENEEVIDLGYLFKILKKHLLFIILVGLVCGAAAFVLSEFEIGRASCRERVSHQV